MFDFDVRANAGDAEAVRARLGGETFAITTLCLDVPVGQIPRGPALILSPEAGVAAAMAAMRRRGARAAIVVQNHRPVGVVTDRDILNACGDSQDLHVVAVGTIMSPCDEPLRETDTVADALRAMCARRSWHLPIVCRRGLFLGALDMADISLWLRDRMTLMSVDAAFAAARRQQLGRRAVALAQCAAAMRDPLVHTRRSSGPSAAAQLCRMLRDSSRQSRHSPRA